MSQERNYSINVAKVKLRSTLLRSTMKLAFLRALRSLYGRGSGLFTSWVIIFLICFPVQAADYYVAKGGNDTNPGTLALPWRSIKKANETLKAGDTVYIRAGSYDERISPTRSGMPGSYITYKAFPGESPVIDRSRVLTNWRRLDGSVYYTSMPDYAAGIWEDEFEQSGYYHSYWPQETLAAIDGPGKYYIKVDTSTVYVWTKNSDDPNNHTMRTAIGSASGWTSREYIELNGLHMKWIHRGAKLSNTSYCILSNLTIKYAAGYGLFLSGGSHHNRIINNTISHIGSWYWDEGDGVFIQGHHNLVDGNDISVTGHNPIATLGDPYPTYNNIIQNNITHDSGSSGLNANMNTYHEVWRNNISYKNTGAGFQTDSSYNIIRNNVFYQNGTGVSIYSTAGRTVTANKIFNNTVYNNNSNYYKYEILIADYRGGICKNIAFKNNIILNTKTSYIIFFDAQDLNDNYMIYNNLFDGNEVSIRLTLLGQKPLSWWKNSYPNNFKGCTSADPQFTDSQNGDFALLPASSNIDSGSFLTKTIGAGSGKEIKVADAGYFCDGFGIVGGDYIQIQGSANKLRVLKVDYEINVLEVATATEWADGAGVSLPYNGSAPDIGAFEHGASVFPPPENVTISIEK